MELKDKLRELRTSFRYSQEEIANYLNVSRQAVSRWETGEAKPCTENLIKLSQLYGGSLYELEDTVIDSLSFQIRLLNDLLKTTVPHSILNQNIEYLVMENGWSQMQYNKLNLFFVQAWRKYKDWSVTYFQKNFMEILATDVSTFTLYKLLMAYSYFTQRKLTPDFEIYPQKEEMLHRLESLLSHLLPSPITNYWDRLKNYGLNIENISDKEPSYIGASAGCGFSLDGCEHEVELYFFDGSNTENVSTSENLKNIMSNRPLSLYFNEITKIENAISDYAYHDGLLLCNYSNHPAKDALLKAFYSHN